MLEIILRGHHVKNLRMVLYSKSHSGMYSRYVDQGDRYDHIIKDPDNTIQIVSTPDSICERCVDQQDCAESGNLYGRSMALFDRIMARSSGVRIGESYKVSELIALLEQQSQLRLAIKEISTIVFYDFAKIPYRILDFVKPRREKPAIRAK